MLNIIDIQKVRKNNTLSVTVHIKERKWAVDEIVLLSTDFLKKKVEKDFNIAIEKTVKSPRHKVGNSNQKGIKTYGTWCFLVKEEKVTPQKGQQKPKTTTSTTKPKRSLRGRMNKLANKT